MNLIFTAMFSLECILKIIAYGFKVTKSHSLFCTPAWPIVCYIYLNRFGSDFFQPLLAFLKHRPCQSVQKVLSQLYAVLVFRKWKCACVFAVNAVQPLSVAHQMSVCNFTRKLRPALERSPVRRSDWNADCIFFRAERNLWLSLSDWSGVKLLSFVDGNRLECRLV